MKLYAKLLACQSLPTKFGTTQAKKYPVALGNELQSYLELYLLLKDKSNFLGTKGTKKVYKLADEYRMICTNLKYDLDWWDDGDSIVITDKGIDKALKEQLDKIKTYVQTEEFQISYLECLSKDIYKDLTKDNTNQIIWQFDSTSYYHNENIFTDKIMKRNGFYKFDDMPEDPDFEYMESFRGTWRKYTIYSMPITVVGKNDLRKSLIGLTADDKVVNIKMQDGQYAYYKTKMTNDPSWFERGTLLVLHGYRIRDEFRLKIYKNDMYEHTIYKINDIKRKDLGLQLSR